MRRREVGIMTVLVGHTRSGESAGKSARESPLFASRRRARLSPSLQQGKCIQRQPVSLAPSLTQSVKTVCLRIEDLLDANTGKERQRSQRSHAFLFFPAPEREKVRKGL